jgi:acyl transferase domain-containing protein
MESAVAVVGLAGRFPGARSVDAFWRNLAGGVESITCFSDDELKAAGVDPGLLANPRYVKAKPLLADVDLFDAAAFGMSAREAEVTDPQHRVFLELCQEALERAGCAPEQFTGSIGVFAGAGLSAYLMHNLAGGGDEPLHVAGAHLGIGNIQDFLATRVAYRLNLKGPAYSVQSACSTSLVAVHLAAQNLLGYECDLALAGGVSISLPVRCGYLFQDEGMLSPDGRCRPFDAAARGTVFGNGAGVVVLKRHDDAVRDGDTIYAVLLGSAVNNDGALKAGFTAPSVLGQASVISEALANAGVDARDVAAIEAHGTATVLGDPIEIEALTRAYREQTDARQFCAIGSVKSNIGHLDTAAGIAGFIKAVLALHHGALPPSLNFAAPNPRIDFGATPFFVNTALRPFAPGAPPIVGVSAFGVGGTNAHAVLRAAPAARPAGAARTWHIVPVSARSDTALAQATTDLADFLDDHPETPIAEAAYTLQVGRRAGEWRRATVVGTTDEAIDRLLELPPGDVFTSARRATARPVVFMFPGQGAQYAGMGTELYEHEPVFRRELDAARDALVRAGLPQLDEEQAALFAFEYALARLWLSWGVRPETMIGHSIGEYAAAAIAGVFSLADAALLVAARARLMAGLPPGAMLAVPMAADAVRPLLDDSVALALVNAPASVVVSGDVSGIAALESRLAARGVTTRRVETARAYHSPLVDGCLDAFAGVCQGVGLHPPQIPFVSSATGRVVTREEAIDPRYWARQLRNPVYFSDGIRELLKDPERIFLEVGPGLTLNALARQNAAPGTSPALLASLPDPRERRSEARGLATAAARLWVAGASLDWNGLHAGAARRRIPLPTYPFERQRYWVEPRTRAVEPATPQRLPDMDAWFALPSWTRRPLPLSPPPPDASWLLVLGRDALSSSLRALVAGRHPDAICVYADELSQPDDYARLVTGAVPSHVVHAATLDAPDDLDRGFFSLLGLGRALGARATRDVQLAIVTPGIHAVVGGERLSPVAATVLGPGIVLGQEFPHLVCRSLDVLPAEAGRDGAGRIYDECVSASADRIAALRGPHRWVRSLEPAPITGARGPEPGARRLKRHGVYLITGGTGGIGLTLAEFLAAQYQARLVLVARTPFVPADVLQRLSSAGAEVVVSPGNVASTADMRRIVGEAVQRWGRIDGVVHAAGVAGGGLAAIKTREAAEAVLAPKVQGTLAIEAALGDRPIDFFVVCSSLASLAGGVGQVDYCAANAFLDAWATARAADGRPAIAIDWDAWQDVGMAVKTALPGEWREARADQLALALTPREGVEVFRRVLDRDYPQVAVCTVGVDARLRASAAVRGPSAEAPERPRHPRPNLPTDYVEPGTDLERRLAAVWGRVLGVDRVGVLDNFFELGGDSLTALRASDLLRQAHGVELSIATLYGAPTIRLLAAQLETV